jgi:hypothetical protein
MLYKRIKTMPYVLKKVVPSRKPYVNWSGSKSSYTAKIEHARRYATLELAQADACGNERAVYVSID